MKKIFAILLAVFAMSVCIFAETEVRTFTLTEYLGLTEDSDLIETVEFIILDENKLERREIPKEDFLLLAETIVLTDVEGSPMFMDENGMAVMEWDGIYIEVYLDESKAEEQTDFERFKFAFVSADGGVDRYTMMFSRLPFKDYVMSREYVDKLYGLAGIALLPEVESDEAPAKVFEADIEAEATHSTHEYNGTALAIVAGILVVITAVTLKLTSKK